MCMHVCGDDEYASTCNCCFSAASVAEGGGGSGGVGRLGQGLAGR